MKTAFERAAHHATGARQPNHYLVTVTLLSGRTTWTSTRGSLQALAWLLPHNIGGTALLRAYLPLVG